MSESLRSQGCPQPRTAPRQERWVWFELAMLADTDSCITWPFADNGWPGYPRLGAHYLHRLAAERMHGPPAPGLTASHLCQHNRRCINPAHLCWESPADNIARTPPIDRRGERNPNAKLTVVQVLELRRLADDGVPTKELARRFGIHATTANDIARRREWSWLA